MKNPIPALVLACAVLVNPAQAASAQSEVRGVALQPIDRGMAAYYAPGLMLRVYVNRLRAGRVRPCPDCVGMAARIDPAELGRKLWVRVRGHFYGPFLIVDCANPADLPLLRERRRVFEVEYSWAMAWQMAGPVPIEVYDQPPA